jgi:hypothetical protein
MRGLGKYKKYKKIKNKKNKNKKYKKIKNKKSGIEDARSRKLGLFGK